MPEESSEDKKKHIEIVFVEVCEVNETINVNGKVRCRGTDRERERQQLDF